MTLQSADVAIDMSVGRMKIISGPFSKNGLHWVAECKCGERVALNICDIRAKIQNNGMCQGCRHKHGHKHGYGSTYNATWSVWQAMKQRCSNPKNVSFENYGKRGIKVCSRWMDSFENFLLDMGERPSRSHSIERKDVDKGYSPSNCTWATRSQQALNTRRNIRFIIDQQEVVGLKAAAIAIGVSKAVLTGCHNRGTLESRFPGVRYA